MTRENGSNRLRIIPAPGAVIVPGLQSSKQEENKSMSESLQEVVDNQEEQPVVSFFVHQADMMQKDADNERLHETMKQITRDQRRGYIFIIVFLVIMFTIRMFIWNSTITSMKDSIIEIASMHHPGCSEVYNAEETDTP